MYIAAKNGKKFNKTTYFGGSRSSMLTFQKSSSPVFATISSMSVPISNCFHAKQANSGKIASFLGVPLFDTSIEGNCITQHHKMLSQDTRDTNL